MKKLFIILSAASLVGLAAACKKDPIAVQSVSLDKTKIELATGNTETLVATVLPNDADDKTVIWSSSDPSIVTVSNGTLTAMKVGKATITATASGFSAECAVSVFFGCPAVDLGLSVKWASWNVGAQNENSLGSYFAWGETEEKTNYSYSVNGDYKWGIYDKNAKPKYGMTKYTADVEGGDGLKTLQPEDDPATVNWGGKWRTPAINEIKELYDKTKCEWTWDAKKKGYIVKGLKTGSTIFLPAAGYRRGTDLWDVGEYGEYWSSSVEVSWLDSALAFYFDSEDHDWDCSRRYFGKTVRAVTEY